MVWIEGETMPKMHRHEGFIRDLAVECAILHSNKEHDKYISYFKDISSITTIDIPNQNSISGKELKDKFKNHPNVQYQEGIEQAIKSVPLKENDILIITGSLYLAGEVLNLN